MAELAVVGAKKSGKITVVEGLVNYLVGKGYRVGTIKHTAHLHQFDTPGKDSYRHRQAGARLTVAMSNEEVVMFAQPDLLDVRQLQYMTCQQIDIWIIEDDRCADRPKVLVTRHWQQVWDMLPESVVATIGPVRLDEVPAHFEEDDYAGLGSFVTNTMLDEKR
ncbi:MAG: molybdopterin-guanine dinucleotide biosynthesis protein B [Candidatus Zixiibacteriota bacterium]